MVFTWFSALSTDDELLESCADDVLRTPSAASTLEEEFERLRLEVWFVLMAVVVIVSAASTLLEDEDIC